MCSGYLSESYPQFSPFQQLEIDDIFAVQRINHNHLVKGLLHIIFIHHESFQLEIGGGDVQRRSRRRVEEEEREYSDYDIEE